MVVNILIYIKGFEDIERVAKVYAPGNGRITAEDWEEAIGKISDRLWDILALRWTNIFTATHEVGHDLFPNLSIVGAVSLQIST